MADVKLLARQICEALKGATMTVTGELLQQVTTGYVKVIERARGEKYSVSEIQDALDKVRERMSGK
jgi:hypothetical protein